MFTLTQVSERLHSGLNNFRVGHYYLQLTYGTENKIQVSLKNLAMDYEMKVATIPDEPLNYDSLLSDMASYIYDCILEEGQEL